MMHLLLAAAAAAGELELTLLSPSAAPLARCMDGSPAGYYLAPNRSSASWIIELEGGGECATRANCDARSGTVLASSKDWPRRRAAGFLSAAADPRLRSFNRVFVPYCSQDLWTGQRTQASAATFGYYFSGHLILEAVLAALNGTGQNASLERSGQEPGPAAGLASAELIVLTGESAGGIGVWPNLDWLAARYPRAKVVGAPIAGFYFFAYPYVGPGHTNSSLADFREAAWPAHVRLWRSFVDADCAAAMPAWRCVLANYTFPYVSSAAFITQAQTDKVVTSMHDWVPHQRVWTEPVRSYFGQWAANMSAALAPSLSDRSPNGVFSAACYIHTGFTPTSPLLAAPDGTRLSYIDAFGRWLFGGEADAHTKLADDCGVLCNPTCAHA